jgi:hypothetical protein
MFLRANKRVKDGKERRYWSVRESRRLRSGPAVHWRAARSCRFCVLSLVGGLP